jgi:glycosyltransferase involved in cell wall biosynthesis
MLSDLALRLSELGHEVEVLTSRGTYAGNRGNSEAGRAARVHAVWGGGSKSRLLNWVLFLAQACLRVPLSSWDRCIILTDPPFLAVSAILGRLLGRRGIYWWTMDLYPEALVAQGSIRRGGVVDRALSLLNEMALASVAGVICLGECQLRRLESYRRWPKAAMEFYRVVPPWDQRPLPPVEAARNRFLAKFGWQEKIVVLYAGNLGEAHTYREVLEAAQVLAGREDWRWQFVFVVRGAHRNALEAQCRGWRNVTVLDYQPEELAADMLWAASIHVITMREGWQGVVVPSKLYGTLQTGAPTLFIGPPDADTASVVREQALGETLVPRSRGEDVIVVLERLAARARRYPVTVPADGPERIAEFVCRAPVQPTRLRAPPQAPGTTSSSTSG